MNELTSVFKGIKQSKVTLNVFFSVGIIFFTLSLFYRYMGLDNEVLYNLGVIFLVFGVMEVKREDQAMLGWALWFSALPIQIFHLFVSESFSVALPFGLLIVVLMSRERMNKEPFMILFYVFILSFFPFESGPLISLAAIVNSYFIMMEENKPRLSHEVYGYYQLSFIRILFLFLTMYSYYVLIALQIMS